MAALAFTALSELICTAVQDKGILYPLNPGGKECQGKRFWRSGKRMTWGGGGGEKYLRHIKPSTETPLKREENLN